MKLRQFRPSGTNRALGASVSAWATQIHSEGGVRAGSVWLVTRSGSPRDETLAGDPFWIAT